MILPSSCRDYKGRLSMVGYIIAILVAIPFPLVACGIYVFLAGVWFLPDRRIEKRLIK